MPEVTRYIARMSYLMRQGDPANQVAILLPTDDVWATFSPTHTTVTGALQPKISPTHGPPSSPPATTSTTSTPKPSTPQASAPTRSSSCPPPTASPSPPSASSRAWTKAGGHIIALGHVPTMTPKANPCRRKSPSSPPPRRHPQTSPPSARPSTTPRHPTSPSPPATTPPAPSSASSAAISPPATSTSSPTPRHQPIDATATFGTTFKNAVAVDPDSATVWDAAATGQPIHLAPYESRVFFFSEGPIHPGATPLPRQSATAATTTPLADLSTDWKVNFASDNKSVTEATLTDWTADPTTKNYSGEAVYSRDFTLASKPGAAVYLAVTGGAALPGAPNSPPEHGAAGSASPLGPDGLPNPAITRTGPGMHAYYDAPIREAALVTINGQAAGALWHPPYRLDISRYLKTGQNHIEIHVFNTALNKWAALPPHDFGPLTAKYGDKFQMQDLNEVKAIPSGILGKIQLTTEAR